MNNLVLLVVAAIAVSCNLASAETLQEACQLAMMPGEAAMQEMKAQGFPDCMQEWMDKDLLPTELPKGMEDVPAFMEKMQAFMEEVTDKERMECGKTYVDDNKAKWEQTVEAMKAASEGRCREKAMEIHNMAMGMFEELKNEIM